MSDNNRKYYGQISLSLMCNLRHKFCFQTAFSTSRLRDDILYEKLLPLYPQIGALRILGGGTDRNSRNQRIPVISEKKQSTDGDRDHHKRGTS